MAFDFPNSPTVGQAYTSAGVTYTWNGQAWIGGPVADVGQYVKKAGDTMAGPLALAADPANIMEASTKQYADKNAVHGHRAGAGVSNLATNAWTKINIGTIAANVGGWTLNAQQLVVPKAGVYLVGASVQLTAPSALTAILVGFGVNSITVPSCSGRGYNAVVNSINYNLNCQRVATLAAGDLLSLMAFCVAAGGQVADSGDATFLWATMLAAL